MNSDIKICCMVMAGIALGFILIPAFHGGDTYFLMSSAQSANVSLALDDLTDVTIIDVANNQIIVYNSSSGQWENMNQTTVSDATVCGNLGSGILICAGDNVQLKSLIAGTGISITNSSTTITIANTLPEATVCTNVGSFAQVYKDGNCNFRTLKGSPDISIAQGTNDITFDYNGTLVTESTVCGNVGTGTIIHVVSSNCNAKSLKAGTGLSISNDTTSITYTNTGVISNSCSSGISCSGTNPSIFTNTLPEQGCSSAGGTTLLKTASTCVFKGLTTSQGITVTSNTNDNNIKTNFANGTGITITGSTTQTFTNLYTCTSAGGTTIIKTSTTGLNCDLKGLTAGVGLTLTSNTNDNNYKTNFVNGTGIRITGTTSQTFTNTLPEQGCSSAGGTSIIKTDATCVFKGLTVNTPIQLISQTNDLNLGCPNCVTISTTPAGHLMGTVFVSKTMTNIGTTNVDIYNTAFDQEDMMFIWCTGITDFRIIWMWDYVGTGTQTVRWVDVANNANVLDTINFAVDQDAGDTGWFAKPSWCTTGNFFFIEQQGSSSVAGDDPIAKGYNIYVR